MIRLDEAGRELSTRGLVEAREEFELEMPKFSQS